MKCEDCDQPATVHASVIVGGTKQEIHLCRRCAEKRQLLTAVDTPNLPMIIKQEVGNVGFLTTDLAKLRCPDCGTDYMEFRKLGRLGCPNDYVVFRAGLLPLLDRVHRATRHVGKRPAKALGLGDASAEKRRLRRELRQAVRAEDYERAARLRDRIREKG